MSAVVVKTRIRTITNHQSKATTIATTFVTIALKQRLDWTTSND
jgi:hypothetical protein